MSSGFHLQNPPGRRGSSWVVFAAAALLVLVWPGGVQTATAQLTCETDADCPGPSFCHEVGLCVCLGADPCYFGLWDSFQNQCLDCGDILGESCILAEGICEWDDFSNQCSPVGLNPDCDCNSNGIRDECDIDCSALDGACEVPGCGQSLDCQPNGIPDECELKDNDCDSNGIPDECLVCPPLDLVFVMDTSGSMSDEGVALCGAIGQVVVDLGNLGVQVNPSFLGITANAWCLTDNVLNLLGDAVPGDGACGPLNHSESWGPATAIVAERFPWTPEALRVIVPISDEGACRGDTCYDPGDDRDSITNAIAVANANDVFVSPIAGTGSSSCVIQLAADLAAGTGGVSYLSTDPDADLAGAINALVLDACLAASDCNSNGIPDVCETDTDGDGIIDDCDNCPLIYNPDQTDTDGDGIGDACDSEPPPPPPCSDVDHDGVCDIVDNCVDTPNGPKLGTCMEDTTDTCLTDAECGADGPCSTNQEDTDGDGVGDVCDNCPETVNPPNPETGEQNDDDGDGIGDACDNCPEDPNENQSDVDNDGLGDVCDDCDLGPNDDRDGDGVFDPCDLCPDDFDSTNADSDGDGIGDVCDNCPDVANEDQADADGDGIGDACEEPPIPQPTPDCIDDADCDDGDLCTTDVCLDGDCVNTPVVCPEGYVCDPETGECVAEERPPTQVVPQTRGGCGIYNGVGLIALPLSMLLWVGARLHSGRRRRR